MYYYYYEDAVSPVRKDKSHKGQKDHSCPFCSDVYDKAQSSICSCPKCRRQRAEDEGNFRQNDIYSAPYFYDNDAQFKSWEDRNEENFRDDRDREYQRDDRDREYQRDDREEDFAPQRYDRYEERHWDDCKGDKKKDKDPCVKVVVNVNVDKEFVVSYEKKPKPPYKCKDRCDCCEVEVFIREKKPCPPPHGDKKPCECCKCVPCRCEKKPIAPPCGCNDRPGPHYWEDERHEHLGPPHFYEPDQGSDCLCEKNQGYAQWEHEHFDGYWDEP